MDTAEANSASAALAAAASARNLAMAAPRPLGPDSLTWQLGFARTGLLYAGRALLMQVAHPVVGAGVRDFSDFRIDPWGRLDRTLDSLMRQLFGGHDLVTEAARLRELHRTIKGTGFDGGHYSALQPEAWAWVHLSNFDTAVRFTDRLVRPLTVADKRELYGEWRQVGLVLGIKSERMPATYDGVAPYVEEMVRERLEANETCFEVLSSLELRTVGPPHPAVPTRLWATLKPLGRRVLHDTTVGTLPPRLRAKLGVPWTDADEVRLQRTLAAARLVGLSTPDRVLHYPRGYRAMRAARRHGRR
jgi:uncharacterized protein (DUF2236 family)